MNVNLDTEMEQLRKDIVEVLNKNKLPVAPKFYIIKDIFRDLEAYYMQKLSNLTTEPPKEESENESSLQQDRMA